MITRPGTTLLELLFVLMIVALVTTMALPSALHARRVLAVRAARAELSSAVATARSAAVLNGGAALTIDMVQGVVWLEALDGSRIGPVHELAARHGVKLESERSRVTVTYDALGIGRLANATIRVRRGEVTAGFTISAYGRVRI
jgi:type II secretory pathway pseudopilin PulG